MGKKDWELSKIYTSKEGSLNIIRKGTSAWVEHSTGQNLVNDDGAEISFKYNGKHNDCLNISFHYTIDAKEPHNSHRNYGRSIIIQKFKVEQLRDFQMIF